MDKLFNIGYGKLSKYIYSIITTSTGKRKKVKLLRNAGTSKRDHFHFGTFSPCKPFAYMKRGIR